MEILSKNLTQNQKAEENWFKQQNKTILLYGPSKVGKTFAYCSVIEDAYNKGNKVRVLSTDKGFRDTFVAYFGEKAEEVSKSVDYKFLCSIEDAQIKMAQMILGIKPDDWVIVDLISDFWDMAQNKFIEDASGGDPSTYILRAAKDPKKFGLFSGQMWQYIKNLDDNLVNNVILRLNCNVLAVASEKDLEVEKAIGGKLSETSKDFTEVGAKPAGQKRLSYKFNSIVYLNKQSGNRYFRIVGTRGMDTQQQPVLFEKNWFKKYQEIIR